MCGICGIFHFDVERPVDRLVVGKMNSRMVHRGPDDAGMFVSQNIALAMRRLSIVDLAHGRQPVTNEDGALQLVFNGEIYNSPDLRSRLQKLGHIFRSQSDTETIIHAYEEYGSDCVHQLRGMFAFAIWDGRLRQLLIARDRLGIKPLYFWRSAEAVIFASEIKALLEYPGVKADLNRAAVPEFLTFGYLSGEETMFRGIRKLLPGHILKASEQGEVGIQEYWRPSAGSTPGDKSPEFYVSTYREKLEEVLNAHLMSDVPLGVFLSGGIDSSVIAAIMAKGRKEPIETFSVGYGEERYSELPFARIVAQHVGAIHHEVQLSGDEFFGLLPKLIWQEDEPIAWPSSVALYAVARLARERVKVVLTGEGSDETLAGYARYAWTLRNAGPDRFYRRMTSPGFRSWVRDRLWDSNILSGPLRRKLQHTIIGRDGDHWPTSYFDNFYAAFSEQEQGELLTHEMVSHPGAAYANSARAWEETNGSLLQRLLMTDVRTYLVELLMKQDSMSMAASIESRVPFLDHELVEFAAGIPVELKVRGLQGKRVLKLATGDLLPASILYRKKMGFPTPLARWLAGRHFEEVAQLLLDSRTQARGMIAQASLSRILAEHRAGKRDNTDRIWRLLNFELWHRVFIDQDPDYRTGL